MCEGKTRRKEVRHGSLRYRFDRCDCGCDRFYGSRRASLGKPERGLVAAKGGPFDFASCGRSAQDETRTADPSTRTAIDRAVLIQDDRHGCPALSELISKMRPRRIN